MFSITMLIVSLVGVANAWACYASWRAQAINLSKMSLFILLSPGLAMILSVLLLGESQYLSTSLLLGIVLNFSAILLSLYADFRKGKEGMPVKTVEEKRQSREFYFAVLTYSLIWGIANFLVKYWTLSEVPVGVYISGWYLGSFVGALSIVFVVLKNSRSQEMFGRNQLTQKDLFHLVFVSVAILVSLASTYWAHFLAPQLVVFPLLILGDKIGPILVGFFLFKEQKKFTKEELIYLAIGVFGGILIGFSIYQ